MNNKTISLPISVTLVKVVSHVITQLFFFSGPVRRVQFIPRGPLTSTVPPPPSHLWAPCPAPSPQFSAICSVPLNPPILTSIPRSRESCYPAQVPEVHRDSVPTKQVSLSFRDPFTCQEVTVFLMTPTAPPQGCTIIISSSISINNYYSHSNYKDLLRLSPHCQSRLDISPTHTPTPTCRVNPLL